MTSEKVIEIFKETGALLEGHFILTSGYHSPHYFQCAKVLQYPEYNIMFSKAIADYFRNDKIDVVISPAVGGIVLGTEVGRLLNSRTIFAERKNGIMTLRRGFELLKDENVLICEDVVTTGGSVFEIIKLIRKYGSILKGVGFIIDRSNGKVHFNTKQFSLAKFDVVKYSENEIPEYLLNIPVTKPGSRTLI
ncbi:MAG: orotate phosphoribosyltransferase [Ignavibacteria bacterium]|nr:orotate phosphoribosyltransferase [Ignavibacteria bacterium]